MSVTPSITPPPALGGQTSCRNQESIHTHVTFIFACPPEDKQKHILLPLPPPPPPPTQRHCAPHSLFLRTKQPS